MNDGQNSGEDGLGCARGDGDFIVWRIGLAMQGADFFRDRLAQSRNACHGGVLVVPRLHRTGHFIHQCGVASEVGETLA